MIRRSKILPIMMLLSAASLSAFYGDYSSWHPTFGVDGGVAAVMNAGSSQTFDIDDISEQFYIYTNNNEIQAPAFYGGFVGVEWQGDSNWMFELLIDYNQSSLFPVSGTLTQGIDTDSEDVFDYSYNMRFRQLFGEVKVGYVKWSHILPYLLFGLGSAFNSAQDYTTTAPATLVATRAFADNLKISPTYILGFGFDIPIVDWLRIGVGYRFTDAGKFSLGQATVEDIEVSGTLSQSALYANEFIAQLTFVF